MGLADREHENEFSAVKKRTQKARTRSRGKGVLDQLLGPIDLRSGHRAQKTRADARRASRRSWTATTGPSCVEIKFASGARHRRLLAPMAWRCRFLHRHVDGYHEDGLEVDAANAP